MKRIIVLFFSCIGFLSCHKDAEKQHKQQSSPDTVTKLKSAIKQKPIIDTVYTTDDVRIYADISIDTSKITSVRVRFKPYIYFSDFRVPVDNIKKAKLDLSSNKYGRWYRTSLRNDFACDTANFAGHYTLVSNGCGTECQLNLLIDRHTGKIHDVPFSARGIDYRTDSRMLIVNPPEENGFYYSDCFYCIPKIYVFNEDKKIFEERKP